MRSTTKPKSSGVAMKPTTKPKSSGVAMKPTTKPKSSGVAMKPTTKPNPSGVAEDASAVLPSDALREIAKSHRKDHANTLNLIIKGLLEDTKDRPPYSFPYFEQACVLEYMKENEWELKDLQYYVDLILKNPDQIMTIKENYPDVFKNIMVAIIVLYPLAIGKLPDLVKMYGERGYTITLQSMILYVRYNFALVQDYQKLHSALRMYINISKSTGHRAKELYGLGTRTRKTNAFPITKDPIFSPVVSNKVKIMFDTNYNACKANVDRIITKENNIRSTDKNIHENNKYKSIYRLPSFLSYIDACAEIQSNIDNIDDLKKRKLAQNLTAPDINTAYVYAILGFNHINKPKKDQTQGGF